MQEMLYEQKEAVRHEQTHAEVQPSNVHRRRPWRQGKGQHTEAQENQTNCHGSRIQQVQDWVRLRGQNKFRGLDDYNK